VVYIDFFRKKCLKIELLHICYDRTVECHKESNFNIRLRLVNGYRVLYSGLGLS
jgi:hypothetical protein